MEMMNCKHYIIIYASHGNLIFCMCSCWIGTNDGAIWGFVAPMIAIIIVRLFYCMKKYDLAMY